MLDQGVPLPEGMGQPNHNPFPSQEEMEESGAFDEESYRMNLIIDGKTAVERAGGDTRKVPGEMDLATKYERSIAAFGIEQVKFSLKRGTPRPHDYGMFYAKQFPSFADVSRFINDQLWTGEATVYEIKISSRGRWNGVGQYLLQYTEEQSLKYQVRLSELRAKAAAVSGTPDAPPPQAPQQPSQWGQPTPPFGQTQQPSGYPGHQGGYPTQGPPVPQQGWAPPGQTPPQQPWTPATQGHGGELQEIRTHLYDQGRRVDGLIDMFNRVARGEIHFGPAVQAPQAPPQQAPVPQQPMAVAPVAAPEPQRPQTPQDQAADLFAHARAAASYEKSFQELVGAVGYVSPLDVITIKHAHEMEKMQLEHKLQRERDKAAEIERAPAPVAAPAVVAPKIPVLTPIPMTKFQMVSDPVTGELASPTSATFVMAQIPAALGYLSEAYTEVQKIMKDKKTAEAQVVEAKEKQIEIAQKQLALEREQVEIAERRRLLQAGHMPQGLGLAAPAPLPPPPPMPTPAETPVQAAPPPMPAAPAPVPEAPRPVEVTQVESTASPFFATGPQGMFATAQFDDEDTDDADDEPTGDSAPEEAPAP